MTSIPTPPASVRSALAMLSRVRDSLPGSQKTCIVAFSGGKDSWAILDFACRIFGKGNVHVYNLYLVPNLECELREIRKAERRYGVVVRRLPHPGLHSALAAGHLQPAATPFRRRLHHADIYEYIRSVTASDWILFGHRIDESLQRRGMLKSSQGYFPRLRKLYPLWNWKAADVYHYLRAAGIPAPEQYTEDDTTGLTLGANTLLYLRKKYPADYAKIIACFPFAEAQFHREDQRLKAGLGPTHYSLKRKQGLMETLNEYIESCGGIGEIDGSDIDGSESGEISKPEEIRPQEEVSSNARTPVNRSESARLTPD